MNDFKIDRMALTIDQSTAATGLGRTTLYCLIGQGKLDARKAGGRTLILAESLRLYLESLPTAPIRTGQKPEL